MKLKQSQSIFHAIINTHSVVPYVNQMKQLNNKTCQYAYKNYRKCKKDCSWNPTSCICENSKD